MKSLRALIEPDHTNILFIFYACRSSKLIVLALQFDFGLVIFGVLNIAYSYLVVQIEQYLQNLQAHFVSDLN
jgi:hypothetical protein